MSVDDRPDDEWPAWATESIHLEESQESWQTRADHLCRELEARLAPWLTRSVEHIGSTSVPGLPAKPIIDLQALVADLADTPAIAETLAPYGWHFVEPELDQRPWRRFFVLVVNDRRSAHLHVMTADAPRWREQLAFRDRLRDHPDLAAAYAALKRELAERHRDDREAYTAAKSAFIRAALQRTRQS